MVKRIFFALVAPIIPMQVAVLQPADEAQAAKVRSIAQLRSEGVPTIDHLTVMYCSAPWHDQGARSALGIEADACFAK
ncbi:hypothetical protein JOH51_005693 [Rhizobium leguminosarum]|nr:hypothetical protein [Rhizobium leguminosarum]MBP2448185.1 hypothetical protein [Rhizobium leguminosarum]